jgi:predicted amidohydrolase
MDISILRIGLVQMRSEKGAVENNLAQIAGFIKRAHRKGVGILGLPEASITGYHDPRRYSRAVISADGPEVNALLRMTRKRQPIVLAGIIETHPAGKPFTTQIIARDGRLEGIYHKQAVEDDNGSDGSGYHGDEWFTAGNETRVFDYDGLKYGITICADIGNESIFAEYARQGAKIIFELAAPGLYGTQAARNWKSGYEWWEGVCREYFERYAKKYGIWIAVATAAGRTIDEDFPGGGYLFAPDGTRVYATQNWDPCEVYLEIDMNRGLTRVI